MSHAAARHSHLDLARELGLPGDLSVRPVLMRITVDLFLSKPHHSADEIIQFQEIAMHLVHDLDAAILLPMAEKLARSDLTPKSVIQNLLKRGGQIAATVFRHSMLLERETLLDSAKWGTFQIALAIARRPIFDDVLTRCLCERPEEEVILTLLENRATSIDPSTVAYLIRRARKSPMLAQALAERADLIGDMTPLFLWAPRHVRDEIILAARRMDLGDTARYHASAQETSVHLGLERMAINQETPTFEEALAAELGCDPQTIDLVMQDESGESLAIALAAIAMPAQAAARILMKVDPAISHSAEQVMRLTRLVSVLGPRTARRLAGAFLHISPVAPADQVRTIAQAREWPSRPQYSSLTVVPDRMPAAAGKQTG